MIGVLEINDPEYTLDIPEEVPDFGALLRSIRNFHGMTVQDLAKRVAVPPSKISNIELSRADLPPENVLIKWLHSLGLSTLQVKKIILLSRNFRIQHWIKLNRNETANPDILRLLDAYRLKKLTDFDRTILRIIART